MSIICYMRALCARATDGRAACERAAEERLRAYGLRAEGLRAEGLHVQGLHVQGLRAEGLRAGGLRLEEPRAGGLGEVPIGCKHGGLVDEDEYVDMPKGPGLLLREPGLE